MTNYNKILSKTSFEEQKGLKIEKLLEQNLNAIYTDKKISKKYSWATIGYWIGFSITLIALAIFIVFTGLLVAFILSKLPQLEASKSVVFSVLFSSFLIVFAIGFCIFYIGHKSRKALKTEIIAKIDKYSIYQNLFKYFDLDFKHNLDENQKLIINRHTINFFKNINNFNNIAKNFNLLNGKYEQYEATSKNQYFKLQNLEYKGFIWKEKASLKNRELRKLRRNQSEEYGQLIELKKVIKRFGIAVKLHNINDQISLSLFDEKNLYSPKEYQDVELPNSYKNLLLKSSTPEKLDEWLAEKNNLEYLLNIINELSISHVNNPLTKNKESKNNLIKNISLLIRNKEAFIWFDSPSELLDLCFNAKTIKKEEILKILRNKILDDFYLIYLALQLLVPFGLDLAIVAEKEEIKPKETAKEKESEKAEAENKNQQKEIQEDSIDEF